MLGSVPSLCQGCSSFWNALPAHPLLLVNFFIRSQRKAGPGLPGPLSGMPILWHLVLPAFIPLFFPLSVSPTGRAWHVSCFPKCAQPLAVAPSRAARSHHHCHTEAETHVCLKVNATLLPGALLLGWPEGTHQASLGLGARG